MPTSKIIPPLPKIQRVYDNHLLNSKVWEQFKPREGDVIISTSIKAGTTWMQAIVGSLIFQDQTMPGRCSELSPWLEERMAPTAERLQLLEAQKHRRFIKTHLPLNALPYFPEVQYIYVGRDGRDVFMSLWNYHRHFLPKTYENHNVFLAPRNQFLPPCPDDIHDFFAQWISKSWFPWENEGFPYWSPLYHLQTWWDYRHLPNILFVHFNDLLADLDGEVRRIAKYLNILSNEATWQALVENVTFKSMKKNADDFVPDGGHFLQGGAQRFINKGTNGRWQGILTTDELYQYEAAAIRQLNLESKQWLELGTAAFSTSNET
jgi:aryl sulfotransferase